MPPYPRESQSLLIVGVDRTPGSARHTASGGIPSLVLALIKVGAFVIFGYVLLVGSGHDIVTEYGDAHSIR